VLAVCLRFCRPFLATPAKKEGALQHLDPGYYSSQRHRLLGTWAERTLGGAMPPPLGEGAVLPHPFLSPDRGEGEEGPHFVAEIFFLTQRLIHVGLMPTGGPGSWRARLAAPAADSPSIRLLLSMLPNVCLPTLHWLQCTASRP
jgi:hypothetical protein